MRPARTLRMDDSWRAGITVSFVVQRGCPAPDTPRARLRGSRARDGGGLVDVALAGDDPVLDDSGADAVTTAEHEHRHREADGTADHEDHADDVDVDAAHGRVDREGQNRAEREQEDACADAHEIPPARSGTAVRDPLSRSTEIYPRSPSRHTANRVTDGGGVALSWPVPVLGTWV